MIAQQKYNESKAALDKNSITRVSEAANILDQIQDPFFKGRVVLEFLKKNIHLDLEIIAQSYSNCPRKILRDQILVEGLRHAVENKDQKSELKLLKLGGLSILVAQKLSQQNNNKLARKVLVEEYVPPHGIEASARHLYQLLGLNLIESRIIKAGAETLGVSGWRILALNRLSMSVNENYSSIVRRFMYLRQKDREDSFGTAIRDSVNATKIREAFNGPLKPHDFSDDEDYNPLDDVVHFLKAAGAIELAVDAAFKHKDFDRAFELATDFIIAAASLEEISSAINTFKRISPKESRYLNSILEARGLTPTQAYLLFSEGKVNEALEIFKRLKNPPVAVKYFLFSKFMSERLNNDENLIDKIERDKSLATDLIFAEIRERNEPGSLKVQINKIINTYKEYESNQERSWTTNLGGPTSNRLEFLYKTLISKPLPRAENVSLEKAVSSEAANSFKSAYYYGFYGDLDGGLESLVAEALNKAKNYKLYREELELNELMGDFPRAKYLAEELKDFKKDELLGKIIKLLGDPPTST